MKRIVPHNPIWADLFVVESVALSDQLRPILITSHHIGSTAIVGLPSKPVIDMLFEVTSLSLLDKHEDVFRRRGYDPRGEYGIAGRRYFSKKSDGEILGYHAHAYEKGNHQIRRHLAFRDYLRLKPEIATDYANIKRQLSDSDGVLASNYQEAKKSWVDAMSLEALHHFSEKS